MVVIGRARLAGFVDVVVIGRAGLAGFVDVVVIGRARLAGFVDVVVISRARLAGFVDVGLSRGGFRCGLGGLAHRPSDQSGGEAEKKGRFHA